MHVIRLGFAGVVLTTMLVVGACPGGVDDEALSVSGTLERNGSGSAPVDVDYASGTSRGEWWACDMRSTAAGCVDGHHVNIYVALPQVTAFAELGQTSCAVDGVANGVYETFDRENGGTYDVGSDLSVFVLVASDVTEDVPGADFEDDAETTAASRLVRGTLDVTTFGGLDGRLRYFVEGETEDGHAVRIDFNGPMVNATTIPALEKPSTCVSDP